MSKQDDGNLKESSIAKARELLKSLNAILPELGILEVAIVNPKNCIAQPKNARYFKPETFAQLVENIKEQGMESTPLCYPMDASKDEKLKGKYLIISGHHRIDAAKQAGKDFILILVARPENRDGIVSRQIAHNALVGLDDEVILKELFEEIEDLNWRVKSGLDSAIQKVQYDSINFKVGIFKEMNIMFIPEDIELWEKGIAEIEQELSSKPIKSSSIVEALPISAFDSFADCLRKVKRVENIKNNGAAVLRMLSLAKERINEIDLKQKAEKKAEAEKKGKNKSIKKKAK